MSERLSRLDLGRFTLPRDVVLRMLAAVAVALVLWGVVTTQQDPVIQRTFTDVPITSPALPNELEIPVSLGTATIKLEGPTSLLQGLTADSLAPRINTDGIIAPGTYEVPVEISAPGPIEREITPAQLSIIVDQAATRSFPVRWEIEPVPDNTRTVTEVQPEVSEATVTGPRSIVDRVARVIFRVDIGQRSSNFVADYPLLAVDANGVELNEVEVRPRRLSASVAIEARGRLVPVLVPTTGSPAEGYDVTDRVVSPPAVLLSGPDDLVAGLISVSTESVDIDGATEAVTRRVALTGLPPGVEIIDPSNGSVLVVIQIQQRGGTQTLPAQPVLVGDVAAGLVASASPPALDVVIFAGDDAIRELKPGDVAPRVSVLGLGPGTYELTPAVLVPPNVRWVRTEPGTVTVTLRRTDDEATPATGGGPAPPQRVPGIAIPDGTPVS